MSFIALVKKGPYPFFACHDEKKGYGPFFGQRCGVDGAAVDVA
jgi:hypothetical protein